MDRKCLRITVTYHRCGVLVRLHLPLKKTAVLSGRHFAVANCGTKSWIYHFILRPLLVCNFTMLLVDVLSFTHRKKTLLSINCWSLWNQEDLCKILIVNITCVPLFSVEEHFLTPDFTRTTVHINFKSLLNIYRPVLFKLSWAETWVSPGGSQWRSFFVME